VIIIVGGNYNSLFFFFFLGGLLLFAGYELRCVVFRVLMTFGIDLCFFVLYFGGVLHCAMLCLNDVCYEILSKAI
jgi:hypothetical protein